TSKINLSSGGDGYCHLTNEHILPSGFSQCLRLTP
uniref:Uncharacterized protein n=1 Tax=Ditylenchus dipsaci TaxID=166011 RepID=A0A915D9B3_9BILA